MKLHWESHSDYVNVLKAEKVLKWSKFNLIVVDLKLSL